MNRTLILFLSLIILGTGAYFLLGDDKDGPVTSVVGADRDFSVDREEVYKVFIADRNGNRTTLTRTPEGWRYNEKYVAREDAIENLLTVIDRIRMRFKPTEAALPNMIETLATQGIKVEIYGKNDDLLKSYYIGGATNDERGTYIILEGAEQPYVAEIPSWEGNLRFRYNLTGDDWRDRTVFRLQPSDITQISVEYPKQQNKSFKIDYTGEPSLEPFYPLTPKIQSALRPGTLDAYRNNFEKIISSGYNNLNSKRDEITQQIPFATISVTTKSGEIQSLQLFPIYNDPFVDPKTGVTIQPTEVSAYNGLTHRDDFMILQNPMVSKILWAYDFFYQ